MIFDNLFNNIDVKAEVIVNELLKAGISEEFITIYKIGAFKRQFSKDIEQISIDDSESSNLPSVSISVNREGIYDMLPEGLIHLDDNENITPEKNSEDSKRRDIEEREARRFFHPIENEFMNILFKLEYLESENQNQFSSLSNKDLFNKVYGYIPEFNDVQIAKLLYFLPLAYKLQGNSNMIGFILRNILHMDVSSEFKQGKNESYNYTGSSLNEMSLGVNSYIGTKIKMNSNCLILNFNKLKRNDTESFFNEGITFKIIQKVMSFFLPICYSYEIILNYRDEDKYAETSSESSFSYLGFNSIIN